MSVMSMKRYKVASFKNSLANSFFDYISMIGSDKFDQKAITKYYNEIYDDVDSIDSSCKYFDNDMKKAIEKFQLNPDTVNHDRIARH